MPKCWLQYYDGADIWPRRFDPVDTRIRPDADRERIRSLRHIDHTFTLSKRNQIELIISADELGLYSTKVFIEAFWRDGLQWWYNPDEGSSLPVTGWIEVTIDGGLIPFEYIDDIEDLPEITLTLIERNPR